jgi:hypothetical protein
LRWLGCVAAGNGSLHVWSSSRHLPIRASWLNGKKIAPRATTRPNLARAIESRVENTNEQFFPVTGGFFRAASGQ